MAKFRKRPVIVEAEQWFPGKTIAGLYWVGVGIAAQATQEQIIETCATVPYFELPRIKTLEGDLIVRPGDWIITGTAGEKYPCKPDIFEAIYEPIE